MKENFKILDDGTILREDYFFNQVKGNGAQILPFKRKVWKIFLLSLITLGIYGLIIQFAMAKETNISCQEDGKHTMGFWGALFLSILTLGIFGLIWTCMWLNREANYLSRHGKTPKVRGGAYIGLFIFAMFVSAFSMIAPIYTDQALALIYLALVLVQTIVGISLYCKFIWQHNLVNSTYNEINNFVEKI